MHFKYLIQGILKLTTKPLKVHFTHKIFVTLIFLLLMGCVFVPTVDVQEKNLCDLQTKQLTIGLGGVEKNLNFSGSGCKDAGCILGGLIIAAVAIPVGTLIVSGSIVVVGNTIHWIEEQGVCDQSETHKALDELKKTTLEAGGEVFQSSTDALNWLKNFSNINIDELRVN